MQFQVVGAAGFTVSITDPCFSYILYGNGKSNMLLSGDTITFYAIKDSLEDLVGLQICTSNNNCTDIGAIQSSYYIMQVPVTSSLNNFAIERMQFLALGFGVTLLVSHWSGYLDSTWIDIGANNYEVTSLVMNRLNLSLVNVYTASNRATLTAFEFADLL